MRTPSWTCRALRVVMALTLMSCIYLLPLFTHALEGANWCTAFAHFGGHPYRDDAGLLERGSAVCECGIGARGCAEVFQRSVRGLGISGGINAVRQSGLQVSPLSDCSLRSVEVTCARVL
jgi:hypothetical protein